MLKEYTEGYIFSLELKTIPQLPKKHRKKFSLCRNRLLNGCNTLMSAYKNYFLVSSLQIDFSTQQPTSTLKGRFTTTGVKETLECKNLITLDMVLPFICAFLDCATEYGGHHVLKEISKIYSEFANKLLYGTSDKSMLNWKSFYVRVELVTLNEKEKYFNYMEVYATSIGLR